MGYIAPLEKPTIAGEQYPMFGGGDFGQCGVAGVPLASDVEAHQSHESCETAEVDVGHETRMAQRARAHPGEWPDIERLEYGVRRDPIAGLRAVAEVDRLAVHQHQVNLGVRYPGGFDDVLDRLVCPERPSLHRVPGAGLHKVVQLGVYPQLDRAAHTLHCPPPIKALPQTTGRATAGKLCSVGPGWCSWGRQQHWFGVECGGRMKTVLGLSMTSASVGWVLLDGRGDTLDHDAFDVGGDIESSSQHAAAVRGALAIAAASGHQIRSVGVTWTDDVEAEAELLLKALTDLGFNDVAAVPATASADAPVDLARGAALALTKNADISDAHPESSGDGGSWLASRVRSSVTLVATVLAGVLALSGLGPDSRVAHLRPMTSTPQAVPSVHPPAPPVAVPRIPEPSPLVAGPPPEPDVTAPPPPSLPEQSLPDEQVASPPDVEPIAAVTEPHVPAPTSIQPGPPATAIAGQEPHAPVPAAVHPGPIAPPPVEPTPPPPPPDPIAVVLSPIFGALP